MNATDLGPMLDPAIVLAQHPLLPEHNVNERREQIKKILDGRDARRKIVIMGPCSAWPSEAVEEYAELAAELQEQVREHLLIVLRTYTQKPRTTVGWSGPLHQPDPLETPDMDTGILYCRRMMSAAAKKLGLADEMLFTHNGPYFDDLLSYLAIGARSTEDTEHRNVVSSLDIPVGIKNGTSGDIAIGVNGVIAAQAPHYFPLHGRKIQSTGNPYAHLILRGGGGRSNYDPESFAQADKLMRAAKIIHPSLIVDASHENSLNGKGKDPTLQEMVLSTTMLGVKQQREEYAILKGWMLESFIVEGKQPEKGPTFDMRGLSITDACIGWEQTNRIIRETADALDAVKK